MQVKDTESSWIRAISCCHFLTTSIFALPDLGMFESSVPTALLSNAARSACKQTCAVATALSGRGYQLWERAGPQKAGPETSTGHSAAKPLPRFPEYFDSLLIDIMRAWLSSILKHIEYIKETVFCGKVTYPKSIGWAILSLRLLLKSVTQPWPCTVRQDWLAPPLLASVPHKNKNNTHPPRHIHEYDGSVNPNPVLHLTFSLKKLNESFL